MSKFTSISIFALDYRFLIRSLIHSKISLVIFDTYYMLKEVILSVFTNQGKHTKDEATPIYSIL